LRSSGPTPLLKQCQFQQVAQCHVQLNFECFHVWRCQKLARQPVPLNDHPHSTCLSGISCISYCAWCLLPFHWTPIRRDCLGPRSCCQIFTHTEKIPLTCRQPSCKFSPEVICSSFCPPKQNKLF